MKLKVYVDRISQPSRAVIIFCKVNGIDFEEIKVELSKRQHLSPEFEAINPFKKVPAIVDGRFKLFESHAILIYLASAFLGVADHCGKIAMKLLFVQKEANSNEWSWSDVSNPIYKCSDKVSENGNANGPDFTQVTRGLTERPEAQESRQICRCKVIAVSGAVKHEDIVEQVKTLFTKLSADPTTASQLVAKEPAIFTGSEVRILDDDIPLHSLQ